MDSPTKAPGAPKAPPRTARWLWLGAGVSLGVALDQITKHLVDARMVLGENIILVDGFFRLRYSRNPGAFFSLGSELDEAPRRFFFTAVTVVAMGLMLELFRKAQPGRRALHWGLGLLLAGAVGNLVDRLASGEVIDFLHVHYGDVFHWATFNVADIYIFVGILLMALDTYRGRAEADDAAGATDAPAPEAT